MCDQCGIWREDPQQREIMPETCTHPYVKIGNTIYERNTEHHDLNYQCHDCGIINGNIHHWGCDMESCPKCCIDNENTDCKLTSSEHLFCNGQFIACECLDEEKNNMIFLTEKEFSLA